ALTVGRQAADTHRQGMVPAARQTMACRVIPVGVPYAVLPRLHFRLPPRRDKPAGRRLCLRGGAMSLWARIRGKIGRPWWLSRSAAWTPAAVNPEGVPLLPLAGGEIVAADAGPDALPAAEARAGAADSL